jgi:hypothetical protein
MVLGATDEPDLDTVSVPENPVVGCNEISYPAGAVRVISAVRSLPLRVSV